MTQYTKSRKLKINSKKRNHSTTKKKGKKICKHNCRTKDCGHTPFLYGGFSQKLDDLGQDLAYTGKPIASVSPNPHFAYTGKGGKGNNYAVSNANYNLSNAYPIVNNQYVPGNPTVNWLNSNTMSGGKRSGSSKRKGLKQKKNGGYPTNKPPPPPPTNDTDTSIAPKPPAPPVPSGPKTPRSISLGGSCGCSNNIPLMKGGCGQCALSQKGGNGFYKNPLPYPNGLVGTAWTPKISSWPGVNGVSGDSNYYPLNTYSPVDISREMIATGASSPFISGGKKKQTKKRHHGGNWSNSFGQDFINLGRTGFYNMNSAYHSLNGLPQPVNPLPWKDQLISR